MDYTDKISLLFQESEEQANLEDRLSLLKQAIKVADAHNDIEWGYQLRLCFMYFERHTNHSRESIPVFIWMMDVYDRNTDVIPSGEFLGIYKEMACLAFNNLEFSLEQINKVTDDFYRRLKDNGDNIREYYSVKINQSLFVGDDKSAREYLEMRDRLPVTNEEIWSEDFDIICNIFVEISENNIQAALFHIKEYESQPEPEIPSVAFYSGLIYQLMLTGQPDSARMYFDEIDGKFSQEEKFPYQIYHISLMMYYMSKHRKDRAWEYFEQFVNWELKADDIYRFHFAASVLPLLNGQEMRKINAIGVNHPCYQPDNAYSLKDLYGHYYNIASDLAQSFDRRNGTDVYVDILEKVL